MKLHKSFLSSMLCLLVVTSCGKKANLDDNGRPSNSLEPSTAELYFNGLQEIKRSLIENDLKAFKNAIRHNPSIDLNQIASDGDTFLITAIKYDFHEIRDYLIEIGADIEKSNVNKETPLMIAAIYKKLDSIDILLNKNVDLENRNANGDTVLHVSIKQNLDQIGVILIKNGSKINSTDRYGRSALKLAQDYNVPETLAQIQAQLDLEYGAPDLANYKSIISKGDYRRLEIIVERFPKTVLENESINPLALVVQAPDETSALRTAQILLDNEANVNGPESADVTPLLKATLARKKAITNLYLNFRANTESLDKDGKSALIHAIEMNDLELVNTLLSYSALEKYTFRKEGKKISFNACDVARATKKKLTSASDKLTNQKIKNSLSCGILSWFF
jgi:ankyrin repeat protein